MSESKRMPGPCLGPWEEIWPCGCAIVEDCLHTRYIRYCRLHEAAPELLAACEAVTCKLQEILEHRTDHFAGECEGEMCLICSPLREALAAIAKATLT